MSQSRFIAANIIQQVLNGKSLTPLFTTLMSKLNRQDQSFVKALCFGVCRYFPRLQAIFNALVEKPLRKKDQDVYCLILIGLYQLMAMHVAEHAAVSETVDATALLKKTWAKNFVNGILRNFLRQKAEIDAAIAPIAEALYLHPKWWLNKFSVDWPQQWETIVAANNQMPPLSIRVNTLKTTRADYLALLNKHNIPAQIISATDCGLIVTTPVAAEDLPGFAEGLVSIQDAAAQLAAFCLDLKPDQRVLDACAAPGGKLTHIFAHEPKLKQLVSVEIDQQRFTAVLENIKRLQLPTEKMNNICADVGDIKSWWDGKLFDRILLDAPCSASGVIRRHPDIKLLRKPEDIAQFGQEQKRLLKSCFTMLKPGGLLVYATCSVFKEENEDIIKHFIEHEPNATLDPIPFDWGIACSEGRQILPGWHEMDGFYYARVRKI